MADSREFVLIGSFQDGITPALEGINNTINRLKTNLGTFAGKKGSFSDLTQSMGKVIGAHIKLSEEVKNLRNELRDSLPVLREYRREVGKAVSANVHLAKGKYIKKNNPYLKFLSDAKKETAELADISKKVQFGSRIPRRGRGGGGGGGVDVGMRTPRPPRPPRTPGIPSGGGGGGGGYIPPTRPSSTFGTKKFGVSRDETFAFGQTLGYTLGSTITGAIVQGFQIGVGFMVKPFQMFAGALQERVQDELSDISAAGGLLSVAKRQKGNPLVQSFQDAMDLTQVTNKRMAEIAAALPGNTQQYIEVGKRLSDTAARMIALDPAKAIKYAQELAVKEGAGRIINTQKDAYTQIIGNMATQGVLAGLGDGGAGAGARGITGAYGLPQLMERIYNEDNVTMGQFQRYAAIFRDPKISDALERFIPKINATMKGSIDRARIMDKFFEEVLPPEMIRAFERSTAGIMEAFRTGLFGPETGILGLGRKFENMGKKMDAYGRYIDDKGVVTSFEKAAKVSLSLFDMLRDIFANVSIVLYPLIDILPQIFDPLKSIGDLLVDARHITGQFLQTFENYVAGLDGLLKTTKKGNADFAKTKKARAGLLAIANFMTDIGAFSEAQFEGLRLDILNKPSKELGEVLNKILTTFFESDTAKDIGNLIGSVIGTTLKQVATVIEYILGVSKTSKLAEGLKDGFYAAGGPEAVRSIIQNIFKGLFTAIVEIFKIAPAEFSAILSAALLIPAFVSSFSILLANKLESVLEFANKAVAAKFRAPSIAESSALYKFDKAKPKITTSGGRLVRPGAAKSAAFRQPSRNIVNPKFPHVALGTRPYADVAGKLGPYRAPKIPKSPSVKKGIPVTIQSVAKDAFTKTKGFLVNRMGAGGMTGLKNPIGMLGKFGTALVAVTGVLNGIVTFFETGDFFKALGATAGPIIGTVLGTALLGPLGGIIGGWIGSQESVIQGLGNIFEHLSSAFGTLIQFVGTLVKDLGWLISKAFNLGDNFDFLGALMKALEAPFYYLRLGMLGVYKMYMEATGKGKTPEAQKIDLEITKLTIGRSLEESIRGQAASFGGNNAAAATGLTRGLEFAKENLARAKAAQQKNAVGGRNKGQIWGGPSYEEVQAYESATELVNKYSAQIAAYEKVLAEIKNPAKKPPTPAPWMSQAVAPGTVPPKGTLPPPPPAAAAVPKEIAQTATETQQLNQKATTQITQAAGIRVASQQTQKNTTTANTLLGNIKSAMFAISNRMELLQSVVVQGLANVQSAILASGSLGGGLGGGGIFGAGAGGQGVNKVIQAGNMLQSMGLNVAENPAFGTGRVGQHAVGSYHYSGRAIDVTGPADKLNEAYELLKGTNPAELLWQVPGHYDHLHVAYALGANNGKMFTNLSAARSWEESMVPGSVKVASITGNSREGFGETSVVNNFTITQQPGEDGEALANRVATLFYDAMNNAQSASIFS